MNRMDGHQVAEKLKGELAARVEALKARGVTPTLAIVVVGDDERTAAYVRAKERMAAELGIDVRVEHIDQTATEQFAERRGTARDSSISEESGHGPNTSEEIPSRDLAHLTHHIQETITRWNSDSSVHGIVLQLPLPQGIDEQALIDQIDPRKDVDGLTATNQAALEAGRELIPPATPMGIIRLLAAYDVPIAGTRVALIGRGRLVGEPLARMLEVRGAEVVTADTSTRDLRAVTRGAAIVIVATGEPELVDAELIDPGTVLVDVGLSERHGRLVGDTTEAAKQKAALATPVPGGVGPMTVVSLLANVVFASELQTLT